MPIQGPLAWLFHLLLPLRLCTVAMAPGHCSNAGHDSANPLYSGGQGREQAALGDGVEGTPEASDVHMHASWH